MRQGAVARALLNMAPFQTSRPARGSRQTGSDCPALAVGLAAASIWENFHNKQRPEKVLGRTSRRLLPPQGVEGWGVGHRDTWPIQVYLAQEGSLTFCFLSLAALRLQHMSSNKFWGKAVWYAPDRVTDITDKQKGPNKKAGGVTAPPSIARAPRPPELP